jgi:MerR family transcriptional regulator, thiopeptide resistance regulator
VTETSGQLWSIGELAKASGVTVRALRHYDEIGVLPVRERTGSGHRRYTGEDLRRLYRIRALRTLGLPLEQIRGGLAGSGEDLASLSGLLRQQLVALTEQAEHVRLLQRQIQDLLDRIEESSMPDPEQFMIALERMTVLEKYFTREQRQQLADRRVELGAERIDDARTRWVSLVEEGLGYLKAGRRADDPEVRDLVRRWDEIGSMFHSAEDTKAAARNMWQENSSELSGRLPWPGDQLRDLVTYLQQAREAG